MLGDLLAVLGFRALKKNSAMNFGMQRLDAASEHLGPAREIGDVAHGNSRISQELGRPAGRDDFGAERRELAREFDDAGFVVHADERALDGHRRHLPREKCYEEKP